MVSRLAGVSVATVSRAFSDPTKLAPTTLEKVRAAAAQLNYRPNALAQALRSNRTYAILVIVPDIANSFYSRVLDGIEEAAKQSGFSPLLANSADDPEFERNCIEMVRARRVDGIIQLGARSIEDLLQRESGSDVPFVHAVERTDRSHAPSVGIDNVEAARLMTQHMISLGHQNIGVIGGSASSDITIHRLNGYKAALSEAGISFDSTLVEYGEYSATSGMDSARSLLARAPAISAVFCLSDEIAFGVMSAARELGIALPQDLSIAGFDNVEFGQYTVPPLTTVRQPSRRMGACAMELMLELLSSPGNPTTKTVIMDAELVIRESVLAHN